MKFKTVISALVLGLSVFSFGIFAHAEETDNSDELNHIHTEEVSHIHNEALLLNPVEEIVTLTDVGTYAVPCPVTGGLHQKKFMSSTTYKGENVGTPHYHDNRYCQAYIRYTKSLYSCIYCGYDTYTTSSETIHPGL